jgi:hypothetical protein
MACTTIAKSYRRYDVQNFQFQIPWMNSEVGQIVAIFWTAWES